MHSVKTERVLTLMKVRLCHYCLVVCISDVVANKLLPALNKNDICPRSESFIAFGLVISSLTYFYLIFIYELR